MSVENYINNKPEWTQSLTLLRTLLLQTELTETIKWNMPTYTLDKKNIVAMVAFKAYVGLWFHQGVFLADTAQLLINANPDGTTKGLRQLRFSNFAEINAQQNLIASYLAEAVLNQKQGKEISPQPKRTIAMPEELAQHLGSTPDLRQSFDALSPASQKEYIAYVAEAKQIATRVRRVAKIAPMITAKVGLNDKYLNRGK